MKITKNRLKQIIKEEIGALTEEDESIEDLMKAIEDFMKDLDYEKARKAVASAIDFDEKVEDMDDLKDLIKTLGSEKDPMDKDRKEELGDIKNALEAALRKRNISEAMSNDRYNELVKAIRKDPDLPKDEQEELIGILNELIIPIRMNVDEKFITLDVLKAIRKDPRYREGETIDADAAGAYSIPGFLTRDDVIKLANKLRLDKEKEASYLSEKLKGNTKMNITKNRLKQIIKEEIEALGEAGFTSLSTGPGIQVTGDDIKAAKNLFAQIKDNDVIVRMKNIIADIDDDDKFDKFKEQYLNFLKNNILIAFPEYKEKFSEGAKAHIMKLIEDDLDDYVYDIAVYGEPMNESVGRLKQIIKEEIENLSK